MIDFEVVQTPKLSIGATIKVVGVGGAGGNTVNSIVDSGCTDIECIAVNTDAQALDLSKAKIKVQIGIKSTKGLGTGADPLIGRRAAEEDLDKVVEAIGAADIVFLTGGMGGGTGSGALPVIAKALKERNILSIIIVTKPFEFEGKRRARVAQEIVTQLESLGDTLIVVPNQKLLAVIDVHMAMIDAFGMIDQLLTQSVRAISDIITRPGHINVDFADVRTVMKDRGIAVMGTGRASGPERARLASLQAISSSLLENMSIQGARGVLLNVAGNRTLTLHELNEAASIVYEAAHEDANIILGTVIDESLKDEVKVTIIATGFERLSQNETILNNAVHEKLPDVQATVSAPEQHSLHLHAAHKTEESSSMQEGMCHSASEKSEIEKQGVAVDEHKQEEVAFFAADELDIPTFLRNKNNSEHRP